MEFGKGQFLEISKHESEPYFFITESEKYLKTIMNGRCVHGHGQNYVSVNSKPDHPPGRAPGIRTFSLPGGVGFSPNHLCPGGWGFQLEKWFYSFERKMQELLDLFQRNWRQLEKHVFLCYFILQKQ